MYDIFWYTDNFEQVKQQAIANSRTEYAWILCEAVNYTNFNLRYVKKFYRFRAPGAINLIS